MANTIITPSIIAREVLDRLYENTLVSRFVYRNYEGDFQGKQGDTISVRRPAQFTANTFVRATGITLQDAVETSFPVTLDTILDVSFAITAEELTLKVDDFSGRFLDPAAMAIAQKIEQTLLALAVGGTVTNAVGTDGTAPTSPQILVDARKILRDNNVPLGGNFAFLTTVTSAVFLKDALLNNAATAGDTAGLREASLGRRFGFDLYESTNFPAISGPTTGTPGDSVVFHPTALALTMRTLQKPNGLPDTQYAAMDFNGFGLRVTQAYDMTKKQDVISIDALFGVKLLDAARIVKIRG